MIEVFKLAKGFTKINKDKLLSFTANSRTTGHPFKLQKSRLRLEARRIFSPIE